MFYSIEGESISKVFIYFSNFRSSGGVPVLPSLLLGCCLCQAYSIGNLLCQAYWPTDGLPSLSSLRTYWWATFTVEPTDLQMGYLHCWAYWPTVGLPPLSSLLKGYILCQAYWWATLSVEPTDGLPTLSSLLMGYLHCRAYWWTTFTV